MNYEEDYDYYDWYYDEDVEDAIEEENQCYYGAEFCDDPQCRDLESCLGCIWTMPPDVQDEMLRDWEAKKKMIE